MMGIVIQTVAVLGITWFVVCSLIKYRKNYASLSSFRGQFPLPFIGNFYVPEAFQFIKYLSILRKKYGKIFTYWAFSKAFLVVCDPVVARRILSDQKCFPKGKDYSEIFGSLCFGSGLVTSSGEKHKNDRAMFSKFFMKNSVLRFVDMMNSVTIATIEEKITRKFAKLTNPSDGLRINMGHFFAVLSLRSFMNFALGWNYEGRLKREDQICRMVSEASANIGTLMIIGIPYVLIRNEWIARWLPLSSGTITARDCIMEDLKPLIDARRAAMDRGEEVDEDSLTIMLREKFTDVAIRDHVVTLISAGHDTTAYFSAYVCLLLGENQKAQDKLREEIISTIGAEGDVTADQVHSMPYFEKVMMECMRLYSTIPFIIRYCVEDVYVKEANVTIPKKTNVIVPLLLMNRDKDNWEDPSQFRPERFDFKDGGNTSEFTSAKHGFFPFGYGARLCLGNTLAQTEAAVFIAHLLREYKIFPSPGFKPKITAGISLTTSNGVEVVLKKL